MQRKKLHYRQSKIFRTRLNGVTMYLKCIEVQGFKSFANKIKFEFHNGITGIVGPNGSGKSNVADAVRWVLGEQRIKQLRGASMQDVIFSGTEMRKPLGYAYVAITLDNSDHQLQVPYDEVTVARKLYRSGESEYLLNGSPCRLKDVNELFYDTGIGKEGYSIIGQGQIDKILSGKPEERRELFDEAAGIVKFKKRKMLSQKKLEEEKQNLLRVNDILAELEKQLAPLEKQSEKAKEYLKYKEELKCLDVNYFLLDNEKSGKELETVTKNLEIATDNLESNKAEFENIKNEYNTLQATLDEIEKDIENTRDSLNNTSNTRTKLEGNIGILKEQINSAHSSVAHYKQQLLQYEENIKNKNAQKEEAKAKQATANEMLAAVEAEMNALKENLEGIRGGIDSLNNEIEDGKNRIFNAVNNRSAIKADKARYEAMLENVSIQKASLNSRLLQAKTNEQQQQDIIKNLEEEFEKITSSINDISNEQQKKEEQLEEMHEELGNLDASLQETQVKYHQDKTKLETISNLTERYEGYGNAIKRVMEQKADTPGIIGVVADIIKVDKKYETAIEIALGGNIQNIVTESEEDAKKMIHFLKENKLGRATFLPLTSIEHPQEFKTPQILDENGVIGMANEIVNTEARYNNVAKAMLGRIVVVDKIDNALKIARKYDYSVRMVTVDGELLVPGGAISGGAFKNNSNLLGRRREMDELNARVKEYLNVIEETMKKIEDLKAARKAIRVEIEELKVRNQEEYIKQNTARLNVIKAQERIDEAMAGVDGLKNEEEDLNNQANEIKLKQTEIDASLEESVRVEKDTEVLIGELQTKLDKLREKEAEAADKVNAKGIEEQKASSEEAFASKDAERIEEELQSVMAECENVKKELENSEAEIAVKEQDIEAILKTIEASHDTESDSEIHLKEIIAKKEELIEKQRTFFESRERLNDTITSLDKEVYRLSAQKDKLTETITGLTSYMWSEYEISLQDAKSLREENMNDLSEIKRNVSSVKDRIKRLGDVNVNAIEDYKNVSERYNFLSKQHDDLIDAEKTLTGIIEELDNAMRKQFAEKFEEISKEFDKVFKELFGGGKGTLEIMEDEDILEAGIKIIAQPPGKKLQNMMQLSGGEKSLAAIALMFAIQNLKPSPFCLLDEIEAALDESNVGRFAGYLHKLTKHTQFIVITHRRGTMEKADRLYGITMQEKGVSALVSVNLIDKELDN